MGSSAYGVPPPRQVDSEETRRRHMEALLEKALKENERLKAAAAVPVEPEQEEAVEPLDGVVYPHGYTPLRGAEIGFGFVNQFTGHMNPFIGIPLAIAGGIVGLFIGSAVESAATR